jgi:Uma2 family endonuclease
MVAVQKTYTPAEYLALERDADYKSEYYQGEIFAMAGGSPNHNAIKEQTAVSIGLHLRKHKCRSYSSDQRIHIPANGLYTYPDLVVVCEPNRYADLRRETLTNPLLLGEVLSPSTAAYDRGDKFALYRSIPTLREYLLIDSTGIRAEVFTKNEAGFWVLTSEADTLAGQVHLQSIDLRLSLADLYATTDELLPDPGSVTD